MENEYFLMIDSREVGVLRCAILWFKNHFEERIKETGVGKNIPSVCNAILTKVRKVNLNEKGRKMEKTLNDCRTEKKMLDACLSWITKILENNGFFIKQNRRELSPFARNVADACMDIETALFYLRGDEDRIEQAGECRLADFGEIVYVHDDDGRIRIVRHGIEGGVYVNYCGGCGKKSSKPIEQI